MANNILVQQLRSKVTIGVTNSIYQNAKVPKPTDFKEGAQDKYGVFAINYSKGNETISTINNQNEVVAFNYNLNINENGKTELPNEVIETVKTAKSISINGKWFITHRIINTENNTITLYGSYIVDNTINSIKLDITSDNNVNCSFNTNAFNAENILLSTDKTNTDNVKDALDEIYNKIININEQALSIIQGDGILVSGNGAEKTISTNIKLHIKTVNGKEMLQLLDKTDDTKVIAEVDASKFVVDGMLDNATYDEETNEIVLVWKDVIDEETSKLKEIRLQVSDFVKPYIEGNGITIENNKISIKVKSNEEYLGVDGNGIYSKGIDNAITKATKNFYTKDDIDGFDFATKADIPTISGGVTEEQVSSAIQTHSNNTDLHVTQTLQNIWNDSAKKSHEHSNKNIIDDITSENISNWNKAKSDIDAFLDANAIKDETINTLKEIQDYISEDAESAVQMISDINTKIGKDDVMLSLKNIKEDFQIFNEQPFVINANKWFCYIETVDAVFPLDLEIYNSNDELIWSVTNENVKVNCQISTEESSNSLKINKVPYDNGLSIETDYITINIGEPIKFKNLSEIHLNGYWLNYDITNFTTEESIQFLNKTKANASDVYTKNEINEKGYLTEHQDISSLIEHTQNDDVHVTPTLKNNWNNYTNTLKITVEETTPSNDSSTVKQYIIKQGGIEVKTINIPKDLVVESGEVIVATEEDKNLIKGDNYLKLILNSSTANPIYIAVKDLVDVYTADETYIKESNNKFSLDLNKVDVDLMDGTRHVGQAISNTLRVIENLQTDISNKANASDVYTKNEINEKGYLTEHQDISHLATKDEVIKNEEVVANALYKIKDSIGLNENGDFIINDNPQSIKTSFEQTSDRIYNVEKVLTQSVKITGYNDSLYDEPFENVTNKLNYKSIYFNGNNYGEDGDTYGVSFKLPSVLNYNEYHYIIFNSNTDISCLMTLPQMHIYEGRVCDVICLNGNNITIAPQSYAEINVIACIDEINGIVQIFIRAIV